MAETRVTISRGAHAGRPFRCLLRHGEDYAFAQQSLTTRSPSKPT
jgi:hypothetical protein